MPVTHLKLILLIVDRTFLLNQPKNSHSHIISAISNIKSKFLNSGVIYLFKYIKFVKEAWITSLYDDCHIFLVEVLVLLAR